MAESVRSKPDVMIVEQSAFTVMHVSALLPSIITPVRGNKAACVSRDLQGHSHLCADGLTDPGLIQRITQH